MKRKNKTIGTGIKIKNPDSIKKLIKVSEGIRKVEEKAWRLLLGELKRIR